MEGLRSDYFMLKSCVGSRNCLNCLRGFRLSCRPIKAISNKSTISILSVYSELNWPPWLGTQSIVRLAARGNEEHISDVFFAESYIWSTKMENKLGNLLTLSSIQSKSPLALVRLSQWSLMGLKYNFRWSRGWCNMLESLSGDSTSKAFVEGKSTR